MDDSLFFKGLKGLCSLNIKNKMQISGCSLLLFGYSSIV